MSDIKKVVLAYSGGLDTSVILKWLQETYQCEVVTFTADLGQGDELEPSREKAKVAGVSFWEKLKNVVFAGVILSLFYYAIWYLIMVVLVNVVKYALNSATGGAQMLEQIQGLKAAMASQAGALAP